MEAFQAGFGRVNTTPLEPVPLAGFGNTSQRFFKAIRDELYATCVAVSDDRGSTVLLFHLDVISVTEQADQAIRQAVLEKTGIPQERTFLCCTHTHSGPDLANDEEPSIVRYIPYLADRCAKAAALALADREQAQLYYGSIEVPHMNFVKHYKYMDKDGKVQYFGDNFGTQVLNETTRHITDADPSLHLLKLVRPGCKDIVMANWRAHAMLTSGHKRYDLSADLAGSFRDAMEAQGDCLFAFYQGAAGNMNPHSRIFEEEITRECTSYGKVMASYARKGLESMTLARPGEIRVTQTVLSGKVDHSMDVHIEKARELVELWAQTNDRELVVREGLPYGFRSPYKATATLRRYDAPLTKELELNAFCLGPDVGFVTAPNELFDTISVMTEEASAYALTFTLGYCGAYKGYIPSRFGYEYTCYESDATWFQAGIGEEIVETFLAMLRQLHTQKA